VLSTSGDTHLGGDDFDKRIVDFLAEDFKKNEGGCWRRWGLFRAGSPSCFLGGSRGSRHGGGRRAPRSPAPAKPRLNTPPPPPRPPTPTPKGIDLLKDRQALQRLTEAAEKAKIELSALSQTSINLPFITATADGPKHIDTTLTRAKFEEMCSDLLDRCRRPVEQALRDAKLSINGAAAGVWAGGSGVGSRGAPRGRRPGPACARAPRPAPALPARHALPPLLTPPLTPPSTPHPLPSQPRQTSRRSSWSAAPPASPRCRTSCAR
jgi:hypothetical protein